MRADACADDAYHIATLCGRLPYEERAGLAKCELGQQLFRLMARKQTNLAVAADVPTCAQVLALADQVGWA